VSEREPARSPAAAAASRRNGTASRGPTTAEGKAASSRNARKHGLFGAEVGAGPISATMAAVFAELEQVSPVPSWQREVATLAALRLSRANELVSYLQAELAARILDSGATTGHVGELITSLLRMQRHARRFRGQRDRALRKILGQPPAAPLGETELDSTASAPPG
jgi:hypothetical protein